MGCAIGPSYLGEGVRSLTERRAGATTLPTLHLREAARLGGMEIAAFQELMDDLYGEADRERGMPSTVAWLCEEVGELAQAVRKGTPEQQLHELGDVLAWLSSLANQLGLSLEDAAQRYVDTPP